MPENTKAHLGGCLQGGDPDTWYPELWKWIYNELGVRSVLDVGCGEGYSTRFFKTLGCDVLGVDGYAEAKRNSVIPDFHVTHDFCTGPYIPPRDYDLVWCCEFVEHVEEKYTQNFLKTFGSSRKYIVMTHAIPGQGGHHHVNCQNDHYWMLKLLEIGFRVDFGLSLQARRLSHGYYRVSGLVFVKDPSVTTKPIQKCLYKIEILLAHVGYQILQKCRPLRALIKRVIRLS